MKKHVLNFILCCIMTSSCLSVSAQDTDHYHRVGDTINGRSPIYYYQWWSEAWLADTSHRLLAYKNVFSLVPIIVHGEYLQYYYTDVPLQIIGIATSCLPATFTTSAAIDWGRNPLYPEYLRLYEASDESFYLIEEVQYEYETPKRYMNLNIRYYPDNIGRDKCCYWHSTDQISTIDIREYYFEKPVTVFDSFYLGHTLENNWVWNYNPNLETYDLQGVTIIPLSLFWDEINMVIPDFCTHTCGSTPNQLKKYRNIRWDIDPNSPTYGDTIDSTRVWHWTEDPHYTLNFPIVVIDSSWIIPPYQCPPVTNLRIAHQGEGRAVLYWDTHPDQNSWQTCWGPQGTPPDSCTRVNNPTQVADIRGLDSCTHYDAYVRGVCYHDSTCYSDWVGPIDIYICDTADGGRGDSLQTVTAMNVLTNIIPNPATMQATVYSSFDISRISVFDANGRMVFDTPMSRHTANLDLKGWATGVYIVIVHTPAGKVAKKLVVR